MVYKIYSNHCPILCNVFVDIKIKIGASRERVITIGEWEHVDINSVVIGNKTGVLTLLSAHRHTCTDTHSLALCARVYVCLCL